MAHEYPAVLKYWFNFADCAFWYKPTTTVLIYSTCFTVTVQSVLSSCYAVFGTHRQGLSSRSNVVWMFAYVFCRCKNTGGPSAQHCSYSADNLFCWHPQQCQHAQMPHLNHYHQSLTWAKNLASLHTSWSFHPLADLLGPLGVPHCLGASLDTSHLLRPQSSLVCLIICFSRADLIKYPDSRDPCLSPHLALPTCSHTA